MRLATPEGTVELPYSDMRADQEGELPVVDGRRARRVPADRALQHVRQGCRPGR